MHGPEAAAGHMAAGMAAMAAAGSSPPDVWVAAGREGGAGRMLCLAACTCMLCCKRR
jgi:hypothetical protein